MDTLTDLSLYRESSAALIANRPISVQKEHCGEEHVFLHICRPSLEPIPVFRGDTGWTVIWIDLNIELN
jgi:hypothetical protein